MFRKYFTVSEANRRLPLVRQIVEDILQKGRILKRLLAEHKGEVSAESLAFQSQIEGLILEIQDLGCFYKDYNFEIGLVDFPAKINNEDVFFCWRSDEADIRWYHPIEEGYAGRKPLNPFQHPASFSPKSS